MLICSRVELKRLCEIFTRMFADPHSKVWLHAAKVLTTRNTAIFHNTISYTFVMHPLWFSFYPTTSLTVPDSAKAKLRISDNPHSHISRTSDHLLNTFRENNEKQVTMCALTLIYTLKYKACRVSVKTVFFNCMPCLSVFVTTRFPRFCGPALSRFSSQSAGFTAAPFLFPTLPSKATPLTEHFYFKYTPGSKGCQHVSLTNQLQFVPI